MKCTEKVAYLQGLMEGLDIGSDTKEGKLFAAIIDVLDDMADAISGISEAHNDLCDQVDAIDSDLGDVEEFLYDEEEDDEEGCSCGHHHHHHEDEDDFDDIEGDLYEVECPACGDTICIDEGLLEEGSIDCPNCGEHLEFDLDEEEGEQASSDEE